MRNPQLTPRSMMDRIGDVLNAAIVFTARYDATDAYYREWSQRYGDKEALWPEAQRLHWHKLWDEQEDAAEALAAVVDLFLELFDPPPPPDKPAP